jgi:Tol biopolymer transport system component/DNA-binding winged helix-turn-helix (wHTH) protein
LGPWVIQPSQNVIVGNGKTTRLEPKMVDVLVCLADHPEETVSKDQLIRTVWGDTFVTDDVLIRCISELRRALEDETREPKFIQTVPRKGYRLLLPTAPIEPKSSSVQFPFLKIWLPAAGLLVILGIGFVFHGRMSSKLPPVTKFVIQPPEGRSFDYIGPIRFSPDGINLALFTNDDEGKALWVRRLDSASVTRLQGTDGAEPVDGVAWSPDGSYLLFVTAGKLKKSNTVGGLPETLCNIQGMSVESMGPNGTVLLSSSLLSDYPKLPMKLLKLSDCSTTTLMPLDDSRYTWGEKWASFLPDGKHFLYAGLRINRQHDVRLGTLGSQTSVLLIHDASDPRYVQPGYIFYERRGYLFAQRFNPGKLQVEGDAIQVVPHQLSYGGLGGVASYDVSSTGMLVYQEQADVAHKLYLADYSGKQEEMLDPAGVSNGPRLSPDGKKLLTGRTDAQAHSSDLWILDLEHRNWEQGTFDSSMGEHWGVWSRDGNTIVYAAALTKANFNIYRTAAQAPHKSELELENDSDKYPTDYSPDGRFLLYTQIVADKGDLWLLPTDASKPFPLIETPFDEQDGRFSPDGRWIVYTSDESGYRDVYVRSFPQPARRYRISWGGGHLPRWSLDGSKIYYLTSDQKLMEQPVQHSSSSFKAGTARFLFYIPGEDSEYEILPGRKFVVNQQLTSWHGPPTVVLNWASAANLKNDPSRP